MWTSQRHMAGAERGAKPAFSSSWSETSLEEPFYLQASLFSKSSVALILSLALSLSLSPSSLPPSPQCPPHCKSKGQSVSYAMETLKGGYRDIESVMVGWGVFLDFLPHTVQAYSLIARTWLCLCLQPGVFPSLHPGASL